MIFEYAGREANFAYQIATGIRESHKSYIDDTAFYEPFTFWHWQGTNSTNHRQPDRRKRRLFWGRDRAFRKDETWWEYLTPIRRWEAFQRRIYKDDYAKRSVKRIAATPWMDVDDIAFIAGFTNMEGLDSGAFGHDHSQPRRSWMDNYADYSQDIATATENFGRRLKWHEGNAPTETPQKLLCGSTTINHEAHAEKIHRDMAESDREYKKRDNVFYYKRGGTDLPPVGDWD